MDSSRYVVPPPFSNQLPAMRHPAPHPLRGRPYSLRDKNDDHEGTRQRACTLQGLEWPPQQSREETWQEAGPPSASRNSTSASLSRDCRTLGSSFGFPNSFPSMLEVYAGLEKRGESESLGPCEGGRLLHPYTGKPED